MAVAPQQGEYDDGRFWFRRKGKVLTLGLTVQGLEELGTLEQLALPEEGKDLDRTEPAGELVGSEGSLTFRVPLSGVVLLVNPDVGSQEVQCVQEDPLEAGWLIQFQVEDPAELFEWVSEEGPQ